MPEESSTRDDRHAGAAAPAHAFAPAEDCSDDEEVALPQPLSPADVDVTSYQAALAGGLRLFALYVAAGGALCMRGAVWRKLMMVLHPDKGGDVRVFQHLTDLKMRLDSGEESGPADTAQGTSVAWTSASEELYRSVRAELHNAARPLGGQALSAVLGL